MKPIQFAILAILAAVAGVKAASTTTNDGVCDDSQCYTRAPACSDDAIAVEIYSDCWTCCDMPDVSVKLEKLHKLLHEVV